MIVLMTVSSPVNGWAGQVDWGGYVVLGADNYIVKSKVINKAIQDIGMGRYNWELFVLCGFGWFADK
jgi:hypothetical protein